MANYRRYFLRSEQISYAPDFEVETFDDYGMDDFDSDFDSSDMDFDW